MKRILFSMMMLLLAAPAFAQPLERLNLDETTAATVRATFQKYRGEMMPLRKSQWQTRRALKEELASAQPDATKITQLTDQLASTRVKLQSINAQRMAELKQELTPQQYAQLLVARHHGFARGMHRHQRGEQPRE